MIALVLCAAFGTSARAGFNVLHDFGQGSDGRDPQGSLVSSPGVLYGMTKYGGSNGAGMVFSMLQDGTGYSNLFDFAPNLTGGSPGGTPRFILGDLYCLTMYGGTNNDGVLFTMAPDGTGYSNIYEFGSTPGGGRKPLGHVSLNWPYLIGLTAYGGSNDDGVVFSVAANGSSYTNLHHFGPGTANGSEPCDSLVGDGTWLYGMTRHGGTADDGVIYRIGPDGSGYAQLHSFDMSSDANGAVPEGSLLRVAGTLYGMARYSGANNQGAIFKIGTNGTGYAHLHDFAGGTSDGGRPFGELIRDNDRLYGMTTYGGTANSGVVFRIGLDGSSYTVLHHLTGGTSNGAWPYGGLLAIDGVLYGLTRFGGAYNGGVLFSLDISIFTQAVDLGDDWRWLDWFGYFNELEYPWINHAQHDWMYVEADAVSHIWFWTSDMGWLWTSDTVYPYFYRSSDAQWLWYMDGSDNPRWFVRMSDGVWEQH